MRNRGRVVCFRLDESEYVSLKEKVKKSGLPQETLIRCILSGVIVKEKPPLDFYKMTNELHFIGHNMNQIAAKAHTTGLIDADEYTRQVKLLRDTVLSIQRAVLLPDEID